MTQRFDYSDFISPHHRLKPRFAALAAAVLSQADDLFSLLSSLSSARNPEEAAGPQLDAFGALCGIPRPSGASEEEYRFLLRARIAARHWDGTNGSLPALLAQAFPGRTAGMADNQDGTVTAVLSGPAPPFPLRDLFPVPAGIRPVIPGS